MKNKVFILLLISIFTTVQAQKNTINLIVGTYTNNCDSKGIYVYNFDTETGNFNLKNASENTVNPSYLTLSKELVPANYNREDFIFGKDKLVMPLEMAIKNTQLKNAN